MHFLNAQDSNELHSWTDLNGRTLQAKFIEADSTTVTIEWNGKAFSITHKHLGFNNKIFG